MTEVEQLNQWLLAKPIHRPNGDMCCPDYSCCNPELLAPLHERERFVGAVQQDDKETQRSMMRVFLRRFFDKQSSKKKVNHENPRDTQSVAEREQL